MSNTSRRDREYRNLERACRTNWGISVPTYRILKALTEFTGVVLIGIMWAQGSLAARYAALVIGGIIFGAEVFETLLERQGAKQ